MNESARMFKAIGEIFRLSMDPNYIPPPLPKCYWCGDDATDVHMYKNAVGTVDVCDDCKRYSMTFAEKALELLTALWHKVL